jgi:hypothetical protein
MAQKLQALSLPNKTNFERLFVLKVPTGSKRGQLALDQAIPGEHGANIRMTPACGSRPRGAWMTMRCRCSRTRT